MNLKSNVNSILFRKVSHSNTLESKDYQQFYTRYKSQT